VTHDNPKLVKPLLDEIRALPCCVPDCRQPYRIEAAHVFTKGKGGGSELTVRFNVAPLCLWHHNRHHHGGEPTADQLFAIIAKREGMTVDDIKTRLWLMLRAPRDATVCEQCGGKGFRGMEKTVRSHCNLCEGAGILRNGLPWREDDAKHSPASTREGQVTRGPAHDHGEAREREDVDDDVHGSAERADDSADKSGWRVL